MSKIVGMLVCPRCRRVGLREQWGRDPEMGRIVCPHCRTAFAEALVFEPEIEHDTGSDGTPD